MSPTVDSASVLSFLGSPFRDAAKVGLDTVSSWIISGAEAMLGEVVKLISLVTTPSLGASWFSPSYWRVAGLAMLLTVPFLFAAAVQAVIRTDLGVLFRAAFVDLPIATLAVTITAPVVALLLAATDEMCAVMTGGGPVGGSFLSSTARSLPQLGTGLMPVVIAVVILLAGMVLLLELIMRAAAIYIVVLFLPLGFAAMVWPARRVWIKRMIEMLIALILSKFVMVAILSLAVAGIASIDPASGSLSTSLTAMALMVLAACSPWVLLHLLPFTELAAGAAGPLRQTARENVGNGMQRGHDALRLAETAALPLVTGGTALANLARQRGTQPSSHGASDSGPDLTPTEPDRPVHPEGPEVDTVADPGQADGDGGGADTTGGSSGSVHGSLPVMGQSTGADQPSQHGPLADQAPIFRHGNGIGGLNLDNQLPGGISFSEDPPEPEDEA